MATTTKKLPTLGLNKDLSNDIYDLIMNINSSQLPFLRNTPKGRCPWTPHGRDLILNNFPNGGNSVEWIEFIISRILGAKGYLVEGYISEGYLSNGLPQSSIEVIDNIVNGKRLIVDHSINKLISTAPPKSTNSIGWVPTISNKKAAEVIDDETHRINQLKAEILSLAKQLKVRQDELHELETKKDAIKNMMIQTGFKGSEADFKTFLKSLA